MLYSTFTAYLGFAVNEDEYKVMGLAAYGRPTMTDAGPQGDPPHAGRRVRPRHWSISSTRRRPRGRIRRGSSSCSAAPRDPYEPIDLETAEGQRFADCAASVQRVLEDTLVDMARALHQETGLPDLCLGGGVALNGVANARILAESGFERVFVPSAPGDAGCALGAALYADRIYFGNPDRRRARSSVLGSDGGRGGTGAGGARGRSGRRRARRRGARSNGSPTSSPPAASSAGWTAPPSSGRARSAIAAFWPRRTRREMRDRLNRDIKYREEFRPFAPVVARRGGRPLFRAAAGRRAAGALHVGRVPGAARVADRSSAAITHVDGSARLQALERDMAPRLYALLEAYGRRTGIPVLLNTSFNVAGEPIVNRALEGYSTFRRCGIDVLVAGPTLRDQARGRRRAAAEGGGRMITKRGGMRRRLIMLGSAGGSIADLVRGLWRQRLRQALARAAGGLSLRVRPGADPGDDRRGAGAVHLRDLLTDGRLPRAARLPGVRGCARGGLVVSRLRRALRRARRDSQPAPSRRRRTDAVRRFYERAPFPGYPPRDSLQALHARAERSAFARLLDRAIPGDARIVEIGCGTGQMCLYLARADRVVIGADLTRAVAPARRRRPRGASGSTACSSSRPICGGPGLKPGAFDVVYSSGVLHHTPDPRASFARLAQLARPGGTIVLGVYNAFARIPSAPAAPGGAAVGLPAACRSIRCCEIAASEPARREAWLRDQYQHPEEHRHTLARGAALVRGKSASSTCGPTRARCWARNRRSCSRRAADNWRPEGWLAQLGWMRTLGHEGGLFFTVGRRS